MPASSASSVDLPAPLGPMRPVRVPRRTDSETPRHGAHAAEVPAHVDRLQDDVRALLAGRFARSVAASPRRAAARPRPPDCRDRTAASRAPGCRRGWPRRDGAGSAMTRFRSGRTPCGRNHRNRAMSSPIATHCRDGSRFGGKLGFAFEISRVDSSNPTGTITAPSNCAEVIPAAADDHGGKQARSSPRRSRRRVTRR